MTGAGRFVHQAAVYADDDEFLAVVLPFLTTAVEAGEPALLCVGERETGLVREALPAGLTVLPSDGYLAPMVALRENRRRIRSHVPAAGRVRMVGVVPHVEGEAWVGWAEYEASVNRLYADLPLSGICAYDARAASTAVLADVRRTHPWLATPAGPRANPGYVEPDGLLAERSRNDAAALARAEPDLVLADPPLERARAAATAAGRVAGLEPARVTDLVVAVNEVVTNAYEHGRPPVTLTLRWARGEVAASVRDRGSGPGDRYAGLLADDQDRAPAGLWLAHRLCRRVVLDPGGGGFTVHLVVS